MQNKIPLPPPKSLEGEERTEINLLGGRGGMLVVKVCSCTCKYTCKCFVPFAKRSPLTR